MKTYKLADVFTPSTPASLTFIDRASVNKQLNRAFNTPGKQLIIFGNSGSGKTTIIKKKLADYKLEHVVTHCMKGMTIADVILDAFNQLDVFYCSQIENAEGNKTTGGLSASYLGIKASIQGESGSNDKNQHKRAVEIPITPQSLAGFFGEAKTCWVVEDFHKLHSDEKIKLAQIMKVFMDMSHNYPNLKIIAIGAVNTAREVVQCDPEMRNRVSEIEVPLMTINELENIVKIGSSLLNISFSDVVTEKIATYSSGLASVTHQLSYLICEEADVSQTLNNRKNIRDKALDIAIDYYISENSDSLKSVYDIATKMNHTRKYETPVDILNAMLKIKKDNITVKEIAGLIKNKHNGNKDSNLKKYIDELITTDRGEILRYDKDSDTYSFSTPFIKAYSYFRLNNVNEESIITKAHLLEELKATLKSELVLAKEQFLIDLSGEI